MTKKKRKEIAYLDFSKAFCKDFNVSLEDKTEICGVDSNIGNGLADKVQCEPTMGRS